MLRERNQSPFYADQDHMTRILCTADLHIGRQSSGFDNESALKAFHRIVEIAIAEPADGVLIAGDLFDSIDAQYVTREEVAAGLGRLKSAAIPVLAVAGNHDYDAIPTFVKAHPELIDVFSSDGWEEKELAGLRVVGRSFGKPTSKNLLQTFDGLLDSRLTIGLVHADVDSNSPYNPTPLTQFGGRGVHAWIIGHVHAPKLWKEHLVAYPGSPQALDPGETGCHGFRWLTVDNGVFTISDVAPLSTVRFESVELHIRPGEDLEDVVAAHMEQTRKSGERLSLRVRLGRLDGASPWCPDSKVPRGADYYEVIEVFDAIDPNFDLEREADQNDARGQAARILLGLERRGDPDWAVQADQLIENVKREMASARKKLKLDLREEFEPLAHAAHDEAHKAVRHSLENVLSARIGGTQ